MLSSGSPLARVVAHVGDAGQAKPHLEHNPLSLLGPCHATPIRKLNDPGGPAALLHAHRRPSPRDGAAQGQSRPGTFTCTGRRHVCIWRWRSGVPHKYHGNRDVSEPSKVPTMPRTHVAQKTHFANNEFEHSSIKGQNPLTQTQSMVQKLTEYAL